MQFIESSMIGVRSARLRLVSRTSPVRITLFPMIHIGEPEFYEATSNDALAHDVILVEGVNSPITKRITRSYRWLVGSQVVAGLIVQPKLVLGQSTARIVHADLSGDEFEKEWRKAPLWIRAALYVLAPLVGLSRRYRGRKSLAKDMNCDDQPSLSELLAMSPETGAFTHAILDSRDARLKEVLGRELDRTPQTTNTLAIVYGAGHMRAVVRELTEMRDYSPESSEWRFVFRLQ